jgi:tetratricopeptide (TPR) repeat protein
MTLLRLWLWALMLFCVASPAEANPDSGANNGAGSTTHAAKSEAFRLGQFAKAADLEHGVRSYDAYILAIRATLAIAAYQTKDRAGAEALIERALSYGQQAQRLNENPVDALLQQGIALGYRAKLRRSPGIAKSARTFMEQALALEPNNALALAALGAWNGEAVADLGSFIARAALGARKDEALRYFTAALRADPDNVSIGIFYAFTLLRLNTKDNSAQASMLLKQALMQKGSDGLDLLLQNQARAILAALDKKDSKTLQAQLALYQPFGQILTQ